MKNDEQPNSKQSDDEQFERKVKASLNANVDALDIDTRNRLTAIRQQALNQKPQHIKWPTLNNWLPATTLAFCSLFAVFLVFNPQNQANLPLQNDQLTMFELLNNAEELDVMIDPDFYAWMDESLEDDTEVAS
jgi:hypothetical protein